MRNNEHNTGLADDSYPYETVQRNESAADSEQNGVNDGELIVMALFCGLGFLVALILVRRMLVRECQSSRETPSSPDSTDYRRLEDSGSDADGDEARFVGDDQGLDVSEWDAGMTGPG